VSPAAEPTLAGHMTCPECPLSVGYSDEDPDAAFSDLLAHIRYRHPQVNQDPAVLWPRIKITEETNRG
jgi:hypothetical protein